MMLKKAYYYIINFFVIKNNMKINFVPLNKIIYFLKKPINATQYFLYKSIDPYMIKTYQFRKYFNLNFIN